MMIELLKWIAIGFGGIIAFILFVLLFADEIASVLIQTRLVDRIPVPMPQDAQIRVSARFMKFMKLFGKVGGAKRPAAVTIGKTIIIWPMLPFNPDKFKSVLFHERVHVEQRLRYGRLYLVRYVLEFVRCRFKYSAHPFEVEANRDAALYL